MSKPHHDSIPGFVPVAPSMWEYTPVRSCDYVEAINAPSLVVICSWTGAQGKHVQKYTMTYQILFPTTRILVITTTAKDLCFRSPVRKQARLRAAVDRIIAYDDSSNILMHVFSEGGSNKAVELAEAYHATTGDRLPCTALCLDSTPGHPRYLRLCSALSKSLPPNPVIHGVGLVFGSAVLAAIWGAYSLVMGYDNNVISQTRRRIMDPEFWDLAAPRCYFYSKADHLIAWRDVREHMLEAMGKGVPVMDVLFEKSGHVRHAAEDPERYWSSVMWAWSRANARRASSSEDRLKMAVEKPEKGISVTVASKTSADSDSDRTLWLQADDIRVGC